jgi:RHS repeat-associated protein
MLDPATDTPASIRSYTIGDDMLAQTDDPLGSGTPDYLLYDGQGSTRQLTDDLIDETDDIIDSFSYDGYGMMLGGNPTAASPAATNLLYTGEQYDANLQQYYLRARYYDPSNGRFNRLDPYSGNNADPQSLHKYLYCHANPVNGIDPTGEFLGGFVGMAITAMYSLMIRGMELAPKAAALMWAVTKIAGIAFLASTIVRMLEVEGWIPESGITEEVQMISGAIFFAGFILTGVLNSIPQPSGKIPYGSSSLSRQVQGVRQGNNFSNARNGAVFQYRANDGSIRTVLRFSQGFTTGGGHAERIIARELEQMGVQSSQVTDIYSELQPCNNPGGYCMPFLREQFPNANISWSFDYLDPATRDAGRQAWLDAINKLF